MAVDIAAYKTRLVELCEAAPITPTSKAYPFFMVEFETYPYWTIQLAPVSVNKIAGFQRDYLMQAILRLHRGKITEGYEGDLEQQSDLDVFTVLDYFEGCNFITPTYPREVPGYNPNSFSIRSEGTRVLPPQGNQRIGSQYIVNWKCRTRRERG